MQRAEVFPAEGEVLRRLFISAGSVQELANQLVDGQSY